MYVRNLIKTPVFLLLFVFLLNACASNTKQNPDDNRGTKKEPEAITQEQGVESTQSPADDTLYPETFSDESPVVGPENYSDPIKGLNRPIFKFNDVVFKYVLNPAARAWQFILPDPVETGIGNFFSNLREPTHTLNHLLQGDPADSGKSLLRFGLNSTIGLLGFFDPASAIWDIDQEETDFADTLASYNVGYGAYLVIPVLGPSDLRDTTSMIVDYFTNPLNLIQDRDTRNGLKLVGGFQEQVPQLIIYPDVVKESEDPYLFVRNLYLQQIQRDAEVLRSSDENSGKNTDEQAEDSENGTYTDQE